MKLYTVKQVARMTGWAAHDVAAAVRFKEVKAYVSEPWLFDRDGVSHAHRDDMRIPESEIERFANGAASARECVIVRIGSAADYVRPEWPHEFETAQMLGLALHAYRGALLDTPNDQEAYGVLRALEAFAENIGLKGIEQRMEAARRAKAA